LEGASDRADQIGQSAACRRTLSRWAATCRSVRLWPTPSTSCPSTGTCVWLATPSTRCGFNCWSHSLRRRSGWWATRCASECGRKAAGRRLRPACLPAWRNWLAWASHKCPSGVGQPHASCRVAHPSEGASHRRFRRPV